MERERVGEGGGEEEEREEEEGERGEDEGFQGEIFTFFILFILILSFETVFHNA